MKLVLHNKRKLGDSNVKEIQEVFLHASKKEEILVMERNVDRILTDMGMRDDYVCLHTRYLVRKTQKW